MGGSESDPPACAFRAETASVRGVHLCKLWLPLSVNDSQASSTRDYDAPAGSPPVALSDTPAATRLQLHRYIRLQLISLGMEELPRCRRPRASSPTACGQLPPEDSPAPRDYRCPADTCIEQFLRTSAASRACRPMRLPGETFSLRSPRESPANSPSRPVPINSRTPGSNPIAFVTASCTIRAATAGPPRARSTSPSRACPFPATRSPFRSRVRQPLQAALNPPDGTADAAFHGRVVAARRPRSARCCCARSSARRSPACARSRRWRSASSPPAAW